MTFVRRQDGRLLVRVTLPMDVIERADELAKATAHDRADILGDLVAEQLPEVLSHAAMELLTSQSLERSNPEPKPGVTSEIAKPTPTPMLLPGRPDMKPLSDGVETP